MANIQNLKPKDSNQDREEAKINGRKGGIASGKARREKKLIREQMEMLLSLPLKDTRAKLKLEELGLEENEINNQMALIVAMWNKALKGDVNAFNSIRDTMGQKPVEQIQNLEPPNISDDI